MAYLEDGLALPGASPREQLVEHHAVAVHVGRLVVAVVVRRVARPTRLEHLHAMGNRKSGWVDEGWFCGGTWPSFPFPRLGSRKRLA